MSVFCWLRLGFICPSGMIIVKQQTCNNKEDTLIKCASMSFWSLIQFELVSGNHFLILDSDVYTYLFFGVCVVRKARKLKANSKSFPRRMWCRPMVQASAKCLQLPVSTSSECEAIYATIAARQREALKNLANTKAKAPFSCGTFCVGNRGAGWVIIWDGLDGNLEDLQECLDWFVYIYNILWHYFWYLLSDFMSGDVGWKKTSDFASL